MVGIISSVVSALQGAKCWSTDPIAVELCWHFETGAPIYYIVREAHKL